jgi:hypothetical protein
VSTEVSGEHIASIFRVEKISSARNQQSTRWPAFLVVYFEIIAVKYILNKIF